MKTSLTFRHYGLLATLCVLPLPTLFAASASRADDLAPADRASTRLARDGVVPVNAVGAYVQPGTFRVQVAAKLGRPDLVLADGSWLYHGHRIERSDAHGTLVVRFSEAGRVSTLALVTPAVVAALRHDPRAPAVNELVATK